MSKMSELCGNVYENKGSTFSRPRQSGNVAENIDSYLLKAGMLLKRKEEQDSGVRSQNEEHLLFADCLLLTAYCLPEL
jgi:hypothetical protein